LYTRPVCGEFAGVEAAGGGSIKADSSGESAIDIDSARGEPAVTRGAEGGESGGTCDFADGEVAIVIDSEGGTSATTIGSEGGDETITISSGGSFLRESRRALGVSTLVLTSGEGRNSHSI